MQIQSASPPEEVAKVTKDRIVTVPRQEQAEAQRIALTSGAQQEAIRAVLDELEAGGELAEAYVQVLLAQGLKENSKWIISGGETTPMVDFRDTP